MIAGLLFAIITVQAAPASHELPVLPAIGTTLSWDAYGMYPLDTEEPLTKAGQQIVKDLEQAERGRAENLARFRLSVDKNDLVPAWALAQIVRQKGMAMVEYRLNVLPFVRDDAPLPTMLYRYSICGLAMREHLASHSQDHTEYATMDRAIQFLRERCRPVATRRLGATITLVRSAAPWDISYRSILESYRQAHPKSVDVRPLLCRNYLAGFTTVGVTKKEALKEPGAPDPIKVTNLAESILKDRPGDALGLYYRGRGRWALDQATPALRDIRAARDTGKLPPILRRSADAFLLHPSDAAFYAAPPVY